MSNEDLYLWALIVVWLTLDDESGLVTTYFYTTDCPCLLYIVHNLLEIVANRG